MRYCHNPDVAAVFLVIHPGELYSHPEQYTGKLVAVRARLMGFDMWIEEFTETCSSYMGVIAVFPGSLKPKPEVHLLRDESFQSLFDDLRRGMNVELVFWYE